MTDNQPLTITKDLVNSRKHGKTLYSGTLSQLPVKKNTRLFGYYRTVCNLAARFIDIIEIHLRTMDGHLPIGVSLKLPSFFKPLMIALAKECCLLFCVSATNTIIQTGKPVIKLHRESVLKHPEWHLAGDNL